MRPYSEALLNVVVELRPACMFAERSPPGPVDRDTPRYGFHPFMSTQPLDDAAEQGQAQQQREAITAGLSDYRGYRAGTGRSCEKLVLQG